tara:strand:- start:318 stop:1535 length:1218 start_codon:yes stop_codon:yes gene_type:complete
MAYIGSPSVSGFSSTTKDRFSGDNSTTGFTLSKAANTGTDIQVYVDNIRQEPTIAYSVSGATLTFTEAPPTGTNNVYVIHQHNSLGTGTLPPQDLGSKDYIFGDDISFNSDGAIVNFGLDSEIKLAHVHNTGLSLQSDSSQLLFGADNDINLTHVHNTGLTTNGNLSLKSDSSVLKFGADEEVTLTHNHNTGLILGGTTPSLTIGDAGAEDTKIVFDGNAQDYHIGLDDSEDALIMGLGSTLGTTTHFSMDSTGAVRMFNQPAFNVNVNSTQTMSAGSVTTLNMDTERFDQNADFNTTTYKFIAPVTGRYFLSTFVRIDHIDISSDYIDMRIRTSNHTYQNVYNSDLEATADNPFKTLTLAVLADMDANDEAYVTVFVEGHVSASSGTTSINTGGSTGFFGYLAC